jgi:two-component system NtrC family sensor kinase
MTETDKVLLVAKEVPAAEALAARLRNGGLDVEVAISGEQCIEKAGTADFHAVILDLAMPGMSGIETFRALREQRPDVRAIFLADQPTIKAAVEAIRLGAADVLEKPIDALTLIEKVREARPGHPAAPDP